MTTAQPTISRRDVGFRSDRGPILIALMMSTALIAIDSTILATAVPTVVGELGSFSSFPWLFSVYLLAQAVSVPLYAKLADTVGRKPMLLFGIGLFFVGSVLCGFAPSMLLLIVFRAVQGLGAGAILPVSITVAGDIYTVEERAKAQGYLASVWAVASVVGPTLGGVFSEFVSWRWIFFVNVPLCVLAGLLLVRNYREQRAVATSRRIDVAGAAAITIGLTALLLGLLEGGQAWAWASVPSIAVFAVAAVALPLFVAIERRAAEPVLPVWVLSRRLLLTTALISFGVGAALTGLTSYVPTFLERVAHVTPLVSGLALAALTLGWPLAAANAGRLYLRMGFRPTVLIGSAITAVGAASVAVVAPFVLTTLSVVGAVMLIALACFVTGVGMGLMATPALIAAQSSVGHDDRGVVTGANLFTRSIGSAVGVAVFGAIANAVIGGAARGAGASAAATGAASVAVFVGAAVAAVLTVLAAVAMPQVWAGSARNEAEGDRAPVERAASTVEPAVEPA